MHDQVQYIYMINPQLKMTRICSSTEYMNNVYLKLDLTDLKLE